MSVLEKNIEQTVVDWAKEHGFLALKVKFVDNGYPDRLFISPSGHTIFIEFKRPGEQPRPLQSYRIAELVKRGIPATWTNSAVEGINILRAALESSRLPDESNSYAAGSSSGGVISGPWTGKNIHRVGRAEDLVFEEVDPASPYSSASATDVQHMARRTWEMGGIQIPLAFDSPRDPEGDGPNYGLTDTLD